MALKWEDIEDLIRGKGGAAIKAAMDSDQYKGEPQEMQDARQNIQDTAPAIRRAIESDPNAGDLGPVFGTGREADPEVRRAIASQLGGQAFGAGVQIPADSSPTQKAPDSAPKQKARAGREELDPATLQDMQDRMAFTNMMGGLAAVSAGMAGKYGNPSGVAQTFQGYRDQIQAPLKEWESRRKRSIENEDRDIAADERTRRHATEDEELGFKRNNEARTATKFEGEQKDAAMKRTQLEQSIDPGSEYSKAMRQGAAQSLKAQQSIVAQRDKPTAALMQTMIDGLTTNDKLSALQVMDVLKPFGKVGEDALRMAHEMANEATAKASTQQGWAQIAETRRMHDATIANQERDDKRQENKDFEATVKGPQEKLNKEIDDKEVAINAMKEIDALKQGIDPKTGKKTGSGVNTGFLTKFASDWLGKPFDLNSASRNEMEALLARVFNKETHELGGSNVTPTEWARIEPQIPQMGDDDDRFRTKLGKAMQIAEEILAKRKQEYQLRKDGTPIDSSKTAARSTGTQAPAKMDPQDEGALAWAKANPNDKRSAAIIAKVKAKYGGI